MVKTVQNPKFDANSQIRSKDACPVLWRLILGHCTFLCNPRIEGNISLASKLESSDRNFCPYRYFSCHFTWWPLACYRRAHCMRSAYIERSFISRERQRGKWLPPAILLNLAKPLLPRKMTDNVPNRKTSRIAPGIVRIIWKYGTCLWHQSSKLPRNCLEITG